MVVPVFRPLILCAALAFAARAAEPAPDATRYLPRDAVALVRVHDLPRTGGRYAHSPYPGLLATPWGAQARGALDDALADPRAAGCDVATLLRPVRHIAAAVALDRAAADPVAGARVGVAVSTSGDDDAIGRLCGALFPIEAALGDGHRTWLDGNGQMTRLEHLWVYRTLDAAVGPDTPQPDGLERDAGFPDACVEGEFSPAGLDAVLGAFARPEAARAAGPSLRVAVRMDPIGLREHLEMPFPAGQAAALGGLAWPAADRAALDGLPTTTVAALALRFAPAVTARAATAMDLAASPALVAVGPYLAWQGLPDALTLLAALDGDCLLWIADGAPLPTFSCVAGMEAETARRVLAALRVRMNLIAQADGALIGTWGMLPFAAGYRDGRLVLTTDPGGVAAALARPGGFTADPAVRAALAEVPADALALGVSRSGAGWGALSQPLLLPFAQIGVPELMSLPADLRMAGRHGFLAWRVIDGRIVVDSGGLFGGPCSWYALATGIGIGGALLTAEPEPAVPRGGAAGSAPEDLVY